MTSLYVYLYTYNTPNRLYGVSPRLYVTYSTLKGESHEIRVQLHEIFWSGFFRESSLTLGGNSNAKTVTIFSNYLNESAHGFPAQIFSQTSGFLIKKIFI